MKIGITQGDANGIGWEIILKTFSDVAMTEICTPIVYGTKHIAEFYAARLHEVEPVQFNVCATAVEVKRGRVNLIECGAQDARVDMGHATVDGAKVAIVALERAAADLREGAIDAVVTAPIDKEAMQKAGFGFTGHTEYLEQQFGAGDVTMFMVSESIKVGVVTGHIPLREVSSAITTEKILSKLRMMRNALKRDFAVDEPKIAVLGLNPHCGDGGLIGDEERTVILPAIQAAQAEGIMAYGPYSADGFFGLGNYMRFDATLAMYHDQGLVPFKALAFEDGVNYTAGLPVVRTSPDHGTAYDMAGRDEADPRSMISSIYTAIDIFRNRLAYDDLLENRLPERENKEKDPRPGKPQIA